ncbi:matrixin family metalloprotease [bacterium RCC_150]
MGDSSDGEDNYGQVTGGSAPEPRKVPERIPLWKLEEMLGEPTPSPTAWREAAAPTPRPKKLRRVAKVVSIVTGIVVLLAGLYFVGPFAPRLNGLGGLTGIANPGAIGPLTPGGPAAGGAALRAKDHPPPGIGENPGPLGRPAPLTATSKSYAFLQKREDGSPVTYDPCRAIHYVTRPDNSPAVGPELIQEAIAAISHATGLTFVNDGDTTEAPSADHRSYQKDRYGDRWAPVLIAWETHAEQPKFTNPARGETVTGLGGSEAVSFGNTGFTYVSGQVELNGPALQRMSAELGTEQVRAVIEHELGHVVGLDHVNDPSQIMNPSETPGVVSFGAGDLTGLSLLGQGKCQPTL